MGFKEDIEAEIVSTHLNPDEFGDTVTYKPLIGSIFEIKVIFDEAYQGIDSESGNTVNSTQPKVIARTSDFTTEPKQGDIIERNSVEYKVSQHIPDGAGISEILLHKKN